MRRVCRVKILVPRRIAKANRWPYLFSQTQDHSTTLLLMTLTMLPLKAEVLLVRKARNKIDEKSTSKNKHLATSISVTNFPVVSETKLSYCLLVLCRDLIITILVRAHHTQLSKPPSMKWKKRCYATHHKVVLNRHPPTWTVIQLKKKKLKCWVRHMKLSRTSTSS